LDVDGLGSAIHCANVPETRNTFVIGAEIRLNALTFAGGFHDDEVAFV